MSGCIIHYEIYNGLELVPLQKEHYEKLICAKQCRKELGGDNEHGRQSCSIPDTFPENSSIHLNCYKQFTKAISINRKRAATDSTSSEKSRVKRTGDLGKKLFPDCCMICRKNTPIKVNGKKQIPKKLEYLNAENAIREACQLKKDDVMCAAIEGTPSLLASEFKVHEKCRKNYTRIVPAKTIRCKEGSFDIDKNMNQGYSLRKRPSISVTEKVENSLCENNGDEKEKQVTSRKQRISISEKSCEGEVVAVGDDLSVREVDGTVEGTNENEITDGVDQASENADKWIFEKGDLPVLIKFIEKHLFIEGQCASVETLTDVYGLDGKDRKARYYVKNIIKEKYQNITFLTTAMNKPQVALANVEYNTGELLHQSNREEILKKAADILRDDTEKFISDEKDNQVFPPTYESMKSIQEKYPRSLSVFFGHLLKSKAHSITERIQRHVNSFTDDIIHSLSRGSIYTLKQVLVGCGIHSLTGSRKTIDILSRLKDSCTIDVVREIETSQAELAQEFANGLFPLPLVPKDEFSKVLIRFWWDNFDVAKENSIGSIHTCHGVAFTERSDETIERPSNVQILRTKRRSMNVETKKLSSRSIDPKIPPPMFDKEDEKRYDNEYAHILPLIWKTQRQLCSSNQMISYRYVGWLSKIFKKEVPKTELKFLPPIPNPITEYSTVLECIYISKKYAEACNMKHTHLTVDCGAAAKFFQVVWNNEKEFENVIIHLGDFHTMQELFSIIGKVMRGSGFEDVLYQANICTTGGINGVLKGKHYNRAWSVHEILAEALHRLFVEREAENLNITDDLRELIKGIEDKNSCNDLVCHPDFISFSNKYADLKNEYLSGKKGKTAQFWIFYMSLVNLQQQLHYSINTNDFFMRLECYKKIVALCFSTNKVNYARYGGYYIKVLENLPQTHPGAAEKLLKNGLSVRRNEIGVGQSIDGAGEQTFMKSSKTSGGIKNFVTDNATYNKWVMSRPYQAKYVEALQEITGLGDSNNNRKCLRPTEISKSEKRVLLVKDILSNTFVSPFLEDLDQTKLFNIASGCQTSEEISKCLLSLQENGSKLLKDFNVRLHKDPPCKENFWTPIKRQDWKDFSAANKKASIKKSTGKTVEIQVQRDVLGYLLAKSQEYGSGIDIDEALKYPLSPVPLSIAHADGEKRKINKSELYKHGLDHSLSLAVDISSVGSRIYILDLASVLRSTVRIPNTFDSLAMQILNAVPKYFVSVYIACDTYRDVSIKSSERKIRGESERLIIRSSKMRVPQDFQRFLSNGANKERLFELIENSWIENKAMLVNRVVYFARGDSCKRIRNDDVVEVDELKTDHEEADTKIAYLIQHAMDNHENISEICVRSPSGDVDIPVILLGLFGHKTTPITVDNGTGKFRRKLRINSSSFSRLQQKALLGYHAISGNDYVSGFLRKTKKIWNTVIVSDGRLLEYFSKLGEGDLTDEMIQATEEFVCTIYGHKKVTSVNTLRAKLFWMRLRKNDRVPDLATLPPCSSTLRKHTTRAHYVAKMWRRAGVPIQSLDHFKDNGWLADGSIDWVHEIFPQNIETLFSSRDDMVEEYDEMDFGDLTDVEDEDDN